jgi:hypothetical protein
MPLSRRCPWKSYCSYSFHVIFNSQVYDILIASIYIYNWLLGVVHQFPVLPYQMCYLYPEILLTSEKSQDVKKH